MEPNHYINPFVGLRAFEESEDYLFFGRGKEIDDLVKKFSENRFLAVIGSSGSGKSSLVKSGMLPQIYGGFMKTGGNWRVAIMQPGENPIGYLAAQLAKEGVLYLDTGDEEMPYEAVIESRLRRSEHGLQHVYNDARLPEGENLLIVVDQFEELFRFSKYEKDNKLGTSDAMHFVQILLTAASLATAPIYVLLTMRSDFLGDCAEFRGLPEAINIGQYLVPRMTRDEIREAITGPVAVSGAEISTRLITRLLNDVNNDTDQLPILQHAMMRTWQAWYQRGQHETPIDFEDYDKIGTMATALSQHADEAYAELSENERGICEAMFKALTDTSSDSRGIRRPKTITDLCILTSAPQSTVKKIVETFRKPGRTFLMPPPDVELRDSTIIDISHESLMRVWTRLVEWTKDEAQSGERYKRLAESTNLWKAGERGLLKDPELGTLLKWKATNSPTAKWAEGYSAPYEDVMGYLEESRNVDNQEKKRAKQRIRNRWLQALAFVILLAGLVSLLSISHYMAIADKLKDSLDNASSKVTIKNIAVPGPTVRVTDTVVKTDTVKLPNNNTPVVPPTTPQQPKLAPSRIYENASSEYARLIQEGPTNNEPFTYPLAAYTAHFDSLGRLIERTGDQRAMAKYNSIKDKLYYDNDLYEKLYTWSGPETRQSMFFVDKRATPRFYGEPDPSDPSVQKINQEMRASGKGIYRTLEAKADKLILCSTTDNWIYVYNSSSGSPVLENRIPFGALVTALGYNPDNNVIYFGLKSGNIGYILYNKDHKNQPVFENNLGSPVISVQCFNGAGAERQNKFLLVAAEKSKITLCKIEGNSLQPYKNLYGNMLPKKDLGPLSKAHFDSNRQLVILQGRTRTGEPIFYAWNPFTAKALEVYRDTYKTNPSLMTSTNIYQD
jgi:energy-coupling factor transporter ATP-binding protein EcfA2